MKQIIFTLFFCSTLLCSAARAQAATEGQRGVAKNPRGIIDAMELMPGMSVAEVGTGSGYMLPFLSRAVGPNGKVIAEDTEQASIDKAKMRAKTSNATNVEFILGTPTDPKLPGDSLDAILVLDAYQDFDHPDQILGGLRESLLSSGRLYIVDYYRQVRLNRDEVIKQVESYGFKLLSGSDHIPQIQYILCFEKKPS